MIEWWTNLEPDGIKTFVGIGAVSSAILFIQMLIVLAGGYLDIPDLDFDIAETGEGGATGMFSIRGIGSFFTGFGWTGASVLDSGGSMTLAIAAATIVGLLVLFGFVSMMRWLQSLREEGNINYENAIGQVGSVYVPIPPNREGLGQIEVKVQSRISTVRAISDHPERLENRVAVRVMELVDDRTLLVEKLK
jgi:membrane protein implicated in regulation of membrane protease activity